MVDNATPVMIAGIGGASLGTEILKSLLTAEAYRVYGCDISPLAFGHYQEGFARTFLADESRYVESLKEICVNQKITALIPGGEAPLNLLAPHAAEFERMGIHLIANSTDVVATCSNKRLFFERMQELGLPMPKTVSVTDADDIGEIPLPCVIKPATGSGGSNLVVLASNLDEASMYVRYLLQNSDTAVIQEYIPENDGEFTIGVLSLPNGEVAGSVAMQRLFNAKLSVLSRTKSGLISSGFSQGLIDEFPEIREQAERIALALGSVGPINVQGRMRDGVLLPFEINPRFSASTYLRTLAGFNEIDIYLRALLNGEVPGPVRISPGYYLRSLSEVRVEKREVKR